MYFSPKTSADGLVFHYDTGNTVRSYLGKPTTNRFSTEITDPTLDSLAIGNGAGSNPQLGSGGTCAVALFNGEKVLAINRGTSSGVYNENRVYWSIALTAGNYYSWSAWVYSTVAGPTLQLEYYGGDYNWGVAQSHNTHTGTGWERLYAYASAPASSNTQTYCFIYVNTNNNIYAKDFQLENQQYPTQFTTGTRSATQGLKDLTAANTIDLSNVSFDANAQMTFDGTNDAISVTTPSGFSGSGTWTLNTWFKINGAPSSTAYMNVILDMNPTGGSANMICVNWSDMRLQYRSRPVGGSYTDINGSILTQNVWYNATVVKNGTSDTKLYLNGVQDGGTYSGDLPAGNQSTFNIGRWTDGTVFANATIPVISIFNRALTADEVARNFNAIKSRFNIG